jgi:hypothetical protein
VSKKWYNYIVSVDDRAGTESDTNVPPNTNNAPATARSAAQSVADIASSVAKEPKFTRSPTCWRTSTFAICPRT